MRSTGVMVRALILRYIGREVLTLANVPESVYHMTYEEAKEAYKNTDIECLDSRLIISIRNSSKIGLYELSDVIIKYNSDDRLPVVIAERIYKCNYSPDEYRKRLDQWKRKVRYIDTENTYRVEMSIEKDYADYIYYSKGWLKRQLKDALRV